MTKQQGITALLLLLSLVLLALGVWQGEPHQVWMKASNICLECIGIG